MQQQTKAEADRQSAIDWARTLVNHDDGFVILDTETTGFKATDEIVQISLLDSSGHVLLSSLVQPQAAIVSSQAEAVHGISNAALVNAATFRELTMAVRSIIGGRVVVAYNMSFDQRTLFQDFERQEYTLPKAKAWECAMLQFAAFNGEWNDYHGSYRWKKLAEAVELCGLKSDGGFHDAAADCRHTLAVIQAMAGQESIT